MLSLGVAFSNVQYGLGIPAVYTGVAVLTDDKPKLAELTRELVSSFDEQMKSDAFSIDALEEFIKKYQPLIRARHYNLKQPNLEEFKKNPFEHMLRNEFETIEAFVSQDLLLQSSTVSECIVRLPIYGNGIQMEIQDPEEHQLPLLGIPILYQGTDDAEGLLNLARLHAKLRYAEDRLRRPQFMNAQLRRAKDQFSQIMNVSWNSPRIESYTGYCVGLPRLIIKKNHVLTALPIEVDSEISFFPVGRYCVGPVASIDEIESACLSASDQKPFGTFLGNRGAEKCAACGGDSDAIEFLYKHSAVPETFEKFPDWFVKSVILNDYAIYFALFGNKLKVGRSLVNKVIGRLIYQCAQDALVMFPIQTFEQADLIETELVRYLEKRKGRIGVSKVTERITAEERLAQVLDWRASRKESQVNRDAIYQRILQLLGQCEKSEVRSLLLLEQKQIELTDNWTLEETGNTSLLSEIQFQWIRGKIRGTAGTFAFLDSGVINLDNLSGYVVKRP